MAISSPTDAVLWRKTKFHRGNKKKYIPLGGWNLVWPGELNPRGSEGNDA